MNLRESSKNTRSHGRAEGKLGKRSFAKRFLEEVLNTFTDENYITITVGELKDIIIRERDLATRRTVDRFFKNATCA
jgi:hypothetical protein